MIFFWDWNFLRQLRWQIICLKQWKNLQFKQQIQSIIWLIGFFDTENFSESAYSSESYSALTRKFSHLIYNFLTTSFTLMFAISNKCCRNKNILTITICFLLGTNFLTMWNIFCSMWVYIIIKKGTKKSSYAYHRCNLRGFTWRLIIFWTYKPKP